VCVERTNGQKEASLVGQGNTTCHIIAIGSAGEFHFEEAVFEQFPMCTVDTFDCTAPSKHWSVPKRISARVRLHRICIGRSDEMVVQSPFVARLSKPLREVYRPRGIHGGDGQRKPGPQLSWASMLDFVGLSRAPPTLLKIDCEGCEYEVFDHILSHSQQALLPAQVSIEAHTGFEASGFGKYGGNNFLWIRQVAPPLQTFYQRLFHDAGYYISHREDGAFSTCCSELVLLRY